MVELSRLEVWPAAWWQKTSGSLAGNQWLWQRPSGGRQLMSTTHGLGQSGTLCLRFWFRRCGTHGLMFKQLRFRSRLPGTHWLWCRLRWQVSFRLGLQRTHRFKQRSCGSSVQFRQAPVQTGPIACRQSGSGGLATGQVRWKEKMYFEKQIYYQSPLLWQMWVHGLILIVQYFSV